MTNNNNPDDGKDILEEAKKHHKEGSMEAYAPRTYELLEKLISQAEKLEDTVARLGYQEKSLQKELEEAKQETQHEIEISGRNVRLFKDTKAELEAVKSASKHTSDLYDQVRADLDTVKKERDGWKTDSERWKELCKTDLVANKNIKLEKEIADLKQKLSKWEGK